MFENEYVECALPQQKSIALIAHDNKKKDMVDWCLKNKKILEHHFLCGTGTTAKLVSDKTGLPVRGYNSGPLGGDQQIGARIVDGKIDLVIFFSDPLEAQPHDPDVKALLRMLRYTTYRSRTIAPRQISSSQAIIWTRNIPVNLSISAIMLICA